MAASDDPRCLAVNNHYGNRINRIAFRIRCSVVGALFKKSTALSTGGKAVYSAGEIVNMMSNDADRCRNLIVQINQLWMLPFNFAFALYGPLNYRTAPHSFS